MNTFFGKETGKLGFGLMRLPKTDSKTFDIPQIKTMVDLFMDAGFNYFDTSRGYPGSEEAIKEALIDRYPRDRYLFATKCPVWAVDSKEKAQKMLDTSLKRTGLDYVDYYLLHNINSDRKKAFDEYDMWDYIQKRKKAGDILHAGFSFHDKAAVLEDLLKEHPEMEFVQLQINYADWEDPAVEARKCYETACRYNKPVIIMEPVKGGTLQDLPDKAAGIFKAADPDASLSSWAIRYAAGLENVMTVLSGMSTEEQMRDNIATLKNFKKLSEDELSVIDRVRKKLDEFKTIPCTSCEYCTKNCPKDIAIPGTFEAVNLYEIYGDLKSAKEKYFWSAEGVGKGKASDCIGCGSCEKACPQKISVRKELEKASSLFE